MIPERELSRSCPPYCVWERTALSSILARRTSAQSASGCFLRVLSGKGIFASHGRMRNACGSRLRSAIFKLSSKQEQGCVRINGAYSSVFRNLLIALWQISLVYFPGNREQSSQGNSPHWCKYFHREARIICYVGACTSERSVYYYRLPVCSYRLLSIIPVPFSFLSFFFN